MLNGRAIYPLLTLDRDDEPVDIAARADVSYSLGRGGMPSVGLSGVLAGPVEVGTPLSSYVGAGLAANLSRQLTMTWHLISGWRLALVGPFRLVTEVQVAGGGTQLVAPAISLGLEFTFGGNR